MKDNIKAGNNIELDDVTILNNISVAEKKEPIVKDNSAPSSEIKLEEKSLPVAEDPSYTQNLASESKTNDIMPKEDDTKIPNGSVEVSFPSNNDIPIPVQPVNIPPVIPTINVQSSNLQSNGGFTPEINNFESNNEYSFNNNDSNNNFNNVSNVSNLPDSYGNSVFKTPADVDKAMEKVVDEIKDSYEKYLSGPTKVLAAFVDEFMRWGQEVTSKGLNRELLEEYDRIVEKVEKYPSAAISANSFNGPSYNNYSNYSDDNNYGGITKF